MSEKRPKTLAEASQDFNKALTDTWRLIEAEYIRAAWRMVEIWKGTK